jgi:hypothetical protein
VQDTAKSCLPQKLLLNPSDDSGAVMLYWEPQRSFEQSAPAIRGHIRWKTCLREVEEK